MGAVTHQRRDRAQRGLTWGARAARTLSNRLFAAAVMVFGVLVVCAVVLYVAERDNPNVHGPLSTFSYVSRALIEGSTPWPLTTPSGRVVHEIILITGRSVLALATGAFASKMVEIVIKRGSGMDDARVSDHIVICGWSSKGPEILRELHAKEVDDKSPVVVLAQLAESPTRDPQVIFVRGNPTDADDLARAGIGRCKTAIILADETGGATGSDIDGRTLLTTLAVESVNLPCYTCVEVVRSENRVHFQRTHANELVVSAELTGALLASSAKTHGLSRFIGDLITHPEGAEFYAVETPAELVGRAFGDAVNELKSRHDYLLVAVGDPLTGYQINPPSDTPIPEGSLLLVVANTPPVLTPASR